MIIDFICQKGNKDHFVPTIKTPRQFPALARNVETTFKRRQKVSRIWVIFIKAKQLGSYEEIYFSTYYMNEILFV